LALRLKMLENNAFALSSVTVNDVNFLSISLQI